MTSSTPSAASKPCSTTSSNAYAATMFSVGLGFLATVAIAIYRMDNDQEPGWTVLAFALLWGIVLSDAVIGFLRSADYSPKAWGRLALLALVPPFRMTTSTRTESGCIWLPGWGWRRKSPHLFVAMERTLSIPMLVIAAFILPVLAIELWGKQWMEAYPALSVATRVCTSFIWLAFATEFILMVSLAEHKLRYCKQHWLDIAIILLPLIAFLRGLRVLRAARLAKLSKTARVFRLRGLATRAYRGLVVLRIIEILIHRNPERQLATLRNTLKEKEKEIEELRERIREVQAKVEKRKQEQEATIDNGQG